VYDKGCVVLNFNIGLCERIMARPSFVGEKFLQTWYIKAFKTRVNSVDFRDSNAPFFTEEELGAFCRFEKISECLI
jgi:hypothetical protein